ncbi:MAG: YsnF/AvaK domain-containing protein [Xenococcaceae cyanobacterium]
MARLPEYSDRHAVDYDYEERVRNVYRATNEQVVGSERETYNYQQDASLYNLNEPNHLTFKLYEERLIANKKRVKAGEVAIGKLVETKIERVEMPITKERLVIERLPASDTNIVASDVPMFAEGEVAWVELHAETPEIYKEAFVREEVKVKKVIEQDIVEATETVRHQELDVTVKGQLDVDAVNRMRDRD